MRMSTRVRLYLLSLAPSWRKLATGYVALLSSFSVSSSCLHPHPPYCSGTVTADDCIDPLHTAWNESFDTGITRKNIPRQNLNYSK